MYKFWNDLPLYLRYAACNRYETINKWIYEHFQFQRGGPFTYEGLDKVH